MWSVNFAIHQLKDLGKISYLNFFVFFYVFVFYCEIHRIQRDIARKLIVRAAGPDVQRGHPSSNSLEFTAEPGKEALDSVVLNLPNAATL